MYVPLNVAFLCSDCSAIFDPQAHQQCPVCASSTHTKLDQIFAAVEEQPDRGPVYPGEDLPEGVTSKRRTPITDLKVVREICRDIATL
jgi:hypothetical protein